MKTLIKKTKIMGRGVYADQVFSKGDAVEVSHCILLKKDKNKDIGKSEINYYVFGNDFDQETVIFALGAGSLFNHKFDANVTYKYDPASNTMTFTATRKIRKGEQLFINYGYDPVREMKKREAWESIAESVTPDPASPSN